jgi:hypothetical protein
MWPLVLLALCGICGCKSSTRTISLGKNEIETLTPIQFRFALPVAASRDGSRIAVAEDGPKGSNETTITVIDTDTQKNLATNRIRNGQGTMMFGADRDTLYMPSGEHYVAWNLSSGKVEKLNVQIPQVEVWPSPDATGWNSDRSIGIKFAQENQTSDKGVTTTFRSPGQLVTEGGKTQEIPYGETVGFDQFGNAWFGKGASWTMVDKTGKAKQSKTHPGFLVHDQSKDRGSMHLRATETEVTHKGAKAYVTCVWLSSDRAVPYTTQEKGKTVRVDKPYKAALVFAGADVYDYCFLPGRKMVFVVSGFGNYLVPYKIAPVEKG